MAKSYLWDLLKDVETNKLPLLVHQPEAWSSVFVDYEPPFVERLWLQLDKDHRLFLHHVKACEADSLWHPHPWPSIVKVMPRSGYEHGIGYDTTHEGECPVGMIQTVYGSMTYEMSDPHAWHYVKPLWSSWSIMITGIPFKTPSPGYIKPTKVLRPLSNERKKFMLDYWIQNFL